MSNSIALIIDDEPDIRALLEITLQRMQIDCRSAADLAQAKACLEEKHVDLSLSDMKLPDSNGLDFVTYMQQLYPEIPVAVITAHGNREATVQTLKSGDFDFVSKPVNLAMLRSLVSTANVPNGRL